MKSIVKNSLMLGLALTALVPTAFAEKDVLLETNPATAVVGSNDFLIETVRPQTETQIKAFAAQWATERAAIQLAEQHGADKKLTETDKKWLSIRDKENKLRNHTYADLFERHTLGRVHFYERSHNWNGENENDNEYHYFTYPGAKNEGKDKYVNSYGFNVLRTMVDSMNAAMQELEKSDLQGSEFTQAVEVSLVSIMEQTQSTVQNDELRYYVNQTVWYATKQTMKERKQIEK